MAEHTEISWAHSTFNPWIGCTKVSPGCDHCYAEVLDRNRFSRTLPDAVLVGREIQRPQVIHWGPGAPRHRTSESNWNLPRKWNRQAEASGQPWRVFCASLADVFDNEVPPAWRWDLFDLIRETQHLTWMILTKRIGNAEEMLPGGWYCHGAPWDARCLGPYPNVWLGITVVNQEEADRDIPKLLAVPAAVRWLSCEPLLGPLDLRRYLVDRRPESPRVDWVIVGGESGKDARPMRQSWALDVRNDCRSHSVPFHFKQWGGARPKDGGHLLEGQEERAFPSLAGRGG